MPSQLTDAPHWQLAVAAFVERHGLEISIEDRLLDLASEVGELAKEVLKATDYGKKPPNVISDDFASELGDALFSLICIANSAGIDLDVALRQALQTYQTRIDRADDAGSGKRRA